ncbi:MAG: hypothetical protein ABII01_05585 [Candidatus Woesearchaeota archaeon]
MKTSNNLIKEVLSEIVGSDTIPLVMYLKNKKNISEFKIAESIKQEVNITRNMLYRLYDLNLVTFIRKKDKVKGWYIYYWTFNPKRVKYLVHDIKVKKLDGLKERLKRENQSNFFICQNKCIRLDFDQVTEFEYKCPECGELMHEDDKVGKIKEIEIQIKKLEKEQNNQTQ